MYHATGTWDAEEEAPDAVVSDIVFCMLKNREQNESHGRAVWMPPAFSILCPVDRYLIAAGLIMDVTGGDVTVEDIDAALEAEEFPAARRKHAADLLARVVKELNDERKSNDGKS